MSNNSMVQDVQNKIDECESAVSDLKGGYVCDIESNIEAVTDSLSEIESELRYVDDELSEKEDQLEEIENRYGSTDPDDWDIPDADEMHELRELRGLGTQHKVLEASHEVQRVIIAGLLAHLRELHGATSEDTISRIMVKAGKTEEKTNG